MRLRLIACAAACAMLSGCGQYFSTILVDNRSGASIEDISVAYKGDRAALGRVPADEARTFRHHFSGEATGTGPVLSLVVNGRSIREELCYFTGMAPFHATITVNPQQIAVHCA